MPHVLPCFTPEAYLLLERSSETRHEYLDGIVHPVPSENLAHSTICFNLAGIIGQQLRGTPCRGFSPNMKVRAGEGGLYAYPDLAVACGEPVFEDEHGDVLLNPAVIFEVLSPSTEACDRGEKFSRYKVIETLTDYVLIAQNRPHVEHLARQPDGTWSCPALDDTAAVITLESIKCRLPLADLYDRVVFQQQ